MERLRLVGPGSDLGFRNSGVQPDNGVILNAKDWEGYRNVQVGFGLVFTRYQTGAGGIAPWLDQENSRTPRRGSRGEIHPDSVVVSVWERGNEENPMLFEDFENLRDEANIRDIKAFLREKGVVLKRKQPQRQTPTPAALPMRPLSNGRTLKNITNYR